MIFRLKIFHGIERDRSKASNTLKNKIYKTTKNRTLHLMLFSYNSSVRVISTMYTRLYRNPLSAQPPTQPDGSTPSGGGSSTPTTIASYGPPRVKERPWARDKRLTKNLSAIEGKDAQSLVSFHVTYIFIHYCWYPAKTETILYRYDILCLELVFLLDDADNEEAKASNEELAKELHVVSVDVCMAENTKNHRTNQYACTSARKNQEGKTLPPELVVRRGQGFTVKIEFNQPVSREGHCLHLIFMTGKKKTNNVKSYFKERNI